MKYINIRGCNGSGKTTLLRSLATDPLCRVARVTVSDHKPVPVTYCPDGLALVGDYTPAAAGSTTAGLDRIKTQAASKFVVESVGSNPDVKLVLFEGLLASVIYGPWLEWSRVNGGMVWAFLDTPLEVCLRRIQERNGGKPIKEQLVADKRRSVIRVRERALADGETVCDLHWETALEDLKSLIESLS